MTQDNAENEAKARELFEIARTCFHYAKPKSPDGVAFERSETGRLLMNAMKKIVAALQPSPLSGDAVEVVASAIDNEMERQCAETPSGPWDSEAIARAAMSALESKTHG